MWWYGGCGPPLVIQTFRSPMRMLLYLRFKSQQNNLSQQGDVSCLLILSHQLINMFVIVLTCLILHLHSKQRILPQSCICVVQITCDNFLDISMSSSFMQHLHLSKSLNVQRSEFRSTLATRYATKVTSFTQSTHLGFCWLTTQ